MVNRHGVQSSTFANLTTVTYGNVTIVFRHGGRPALLMPGHAPTDEAALALIDDPGRFGDYDTPSQRAAFVKAFWAASQHGTQP